MQETPLNRILAKPCKLEHFNNLDVTIVAKEFSPFTTSDKAGGEVVITVQTHEINHKFNSRSDRAL